MDIGLIIGLVILLGGGGFLAWLFDPTTGASQRGGRPKNRHDRKRKRTRNPPR